MEWSNGSIEILILEYKENISALRQIRFINYIQRGAIVGKKLLSSRYEKPLKIINSYNYSGVNDGNRR
jgi:hypothetical protein